MKRRKFLAAAIATTAVSGISTVFGQARPNPPILGGAPPDTLLGPAPFQQLWDQFFIADGTDLSIPLKYRMGLRGLLKLATFSNGVIRGVETQFEGAKVYWQALEYVRDVLGITGDDDIWLTQFGYEVAQTSIRAMHTATQYNGNYYGSVWQPYEKEFQAFKILRDNNLDLTSYVQGNWMGFSVWNGSYFQRNGYNTAGQVVTLTPAEQEIAFPTDPGAQPATSVLESACYTTMQFGFVGTARRIREAALQAEGCIVWDQASGTWNDDKFGAGLLSFDDPVTGGRAPYSKIWLSILANHIWKFRYLDRNGTDPEDGSTLSIYQFWQYGMLLSTMWKIIDLVEARGESWNDWWQATNFGAPSASPVVMLWDKATWPTPYHCIDDFLQWLADDATVAEPGYQDLKIWQPNFGGQQNLNFFLKGDRTDAKGFPVDWNAIRSGQLGSGWTRSAINGGFMPYVYGKMGEYKLNNPAFSGTSWSGIDYFDFADKILLGAVTHGIESNIRNANLISYGGFDYVNLRRRINT